MDKSEAYHSQVNTDPNALIFDVADVSIIADAKKVLPLVREELKQLEHIKVISIKKLSVLNLRGLSLR